MPRSALGHVRVAHGHAAHVRLVDDRLAPGHAGRLVVAPGEGVVDHAAFRHAAGVVAPVERQVLARRCRRGSRNGRRSSAARRAAPWRRDRAAACCGLKRWPARGLVGAVDAVAVEQAGAGLGQIAVPDLVGVLRQRDALRSRAGPRGRTGTARPWSACAENSAKLTPLPSQVAPSGCGRPGHTVISAAAIQRCSMRLVLENHRRQRRQGEATASAAGRASATSSAIDAAAIADVGAAVDRRRRC